MPEFKGLDYGKYPEASKQISKYITQELKTVLKGPVLPEYTEILMIYTSVNYKGWWSKISEELKETFDVSSVE